MPRKLITKLRIRAKSGQAFLRASTLAACHLVSRGRGLLNNAAATRGEICPETVGCTPACWHRLTEANGRDFVCNSNAWSRQRARNFAKALRKTNYSFFGE